MEADHGQRESLCLVCILNNLNLDRASTVLRRCECSSRALGRGHEARRRLVPDDSHGRTMEQRKLPRLLLVSFFDFGLTSSTGYSRLRDLGDVPKKDPGIDP